MKVPMGPPPPRKLSDSNSNSSSIEKTQTNTEIIEPSIPAVTKVPMRPPPPKNPNRSPSKSEANLGEETANITDDESQSQSNSSTTQVAELEERAAEEPGPKSSTDSTTTSEECPGVTVPYTIPPWSGPPAHPFFLEVLKDGAIIDQFNVSEKGAYMFGRVDLCDFVLEHPTISRFHAVLQFKQSGEAYLYDICSTHGTFINKNQVKKKLYTELHVGDVIRFGHSSRLYIFQGPSELMQPEGDLEKIRSAKIQEEMQDREASLLRAKQEASLADGISWGLAEDAIEEDEEDTEDITWQNYKGQLTERQEKTREKVIKRTQKIANMKKEIDAIRAKDIAQGGLTQGQQTQIARNEQRISQIMEELESLEETLNDSIRESMGARAGKNRGKKKGDMEDEDETVSDDDEFYDRTKKNLPSQRVGEHQAIETAETLLDKKEVIVKQMEEKNNLLTKEKNRTVPETEGDNEAGDSLDAYMMGLSSQLEIDAGLQLQNDLSTLQSELDRILYLLKIADPTGEAAKRRDLKEQASKSSESEVKQLDMSNSGIKKQSLTEQKERSKLSKPKQLEEEKPDSVTQSNEIPAVEKSVTNSEESKIPVYSVTKPLWLGATQELDMIENKQEEAPLDLPDSDKFVDYKNREKALGSVESTEVKEESEIESAAPGLIIRKRKRVEKPEGDDDKASGTSTSSSGEADSMAAAESVAQLLKKTQGNFPLDVNGRNETIDNGDHSRKENTKSIRVLGPEKPAFLDSNQNYESWLPPEGQSGDGRTHLNDRFGY